MNSRRAASVGHFLVMEIMERAQALESEGRDVIHLEVGEPDFDSPPLAVEAGIRALEDGRTHYTHSLGIAELRAAIAGHYADEYDVEVDPAQIVVTSGTSPGLLLSFAATCDVGDTIAISDPGYPCYTNIARTLGIEPMPVPVRPEADFTLEPDVVAATVAASTRAVVVNSPSNPFGTITPPQQLAELAELDITVISDEIYHGLTYDGSAQTMLAHDQNAFVVSGFSKRWAMTGWRLGWVIVPKVHLRAVQAMQQNLFISASDFGQHAAVAALAASSDTEDMREAFDERRRYLIDALPAIGLPIPARPRGAFYVFADASAYTDDSMAFAVDVLDKAGVAITPGVDFGQRGEGHIRISYAYALDRIKAGVERLSGYLDQLR